MRILLLPFFKTFQKYLAKICIVLASFVQHLGQAKAKAN